MTGTQAIMIPSIVKKLIVALWPTPLPVGQSFRHAYAISAGTDMIAPHARDPRPQLRHQFLEGLQEPSLLEPIMLQDNDVLDIREHPLQPFEVRCDTGLSLAAMDHEGREHGRRRPVSLHHQTRDIIHDFALLTLGNPAQGCGVSSSAPATFRSADRSNGIRRRQGMTGSRMSDP